MALCKERAARPRGVPGVCAWHWRVAAFNKALVEKAKEFGDKLLKASHTIDRRPIGIVKVLDPREPPSIYDLAVLSSFPSTHLDHTTMRISYDEQTLPSFPYLRFIFY